MERVENYKKWQRVLRLQCDCLIGDYAGVWIYTQRRLNRLENNLKQKPMVSEDYFYFNS